MDFSQLSDLSRNFGSGTPAPQNYTPAPNQSTGSMTRVPTFSDTFNLSSLKSFGNYVQNNANTYLDKLSTREGIQEAALSGHGLGGVGGVAGTFIGKGAKYYDQSLERLASEMHAKGATPEEIWKETGVRRWNSGARQEIADNTAKFKINQFSNPNLTHFRNTGETLSYPEAKNLYEQGLGHEVGSSVSLNNLLEHSELFKNYPQLQGTQVYIKPTFKRGEAQFNPNTNSITISADDFYHQDLTPLLHEIQHNVQKVEGWQSGGNSGQFSTIDTIIPKRGASGFKRRYNAFELYERLPGEMEARMTEQRQHLSELERLMKIPRTEDVPMKDMKVHLRDYGVTK
jgi:hypothetical protein